MKLLVLPRYDRSGASSRQRLLQFVPDLACLGWEITVRPLHQPAYLKALYAGRRRSPLAERGTVRDDGTSPTGAVARLEDQRLLLAALRLIPLDAQMLLELAYQEGLPAAEIAEVMGVATGTLHTRLHRARESLRERVRELAPDRVALVERASDLLKGDA